MIGFFKTTINTESIEMHATCPYVLVNPIFPFLGIINITVWKKTTLKATRLFLKIKLAVFYSVE